MMIPFFIAAIAVPFISEQFVVPKPSTRLRGKAFYILSPIMGTLVYGGFLVLTAHAYLALAGSMLYYLGLTAISNKKFEILGDPFNAHDFENARHLYVYPEFYVGYIGWPAFIGIIALLAGLVAIDFRYEAPISIYNLAPWYLVWPVSLVVWIISLRIAGKIAALFFNEATAANYDVTLDLQKDVARFGLFPTILLYRMLLKTKIDKKALRLRPLKAITKPETAQDIIVVQGESYFDLERLFTKIDPSASWSPLRALEKAGVITGQIDVPTRGAYTMQSEFSFLSGFHGDALGIDSINPYMRLAQRPMTTFVSALKEAGYRTICVHPAKREFFRRSDVLPNLGFDEFIGLEGFEGAERFGEYISDKALGDKLEQLIDAHHSASEQPLFIFAITIESHGPWAKGRLDPHLARGITEAELLAKNITDDAEFPMYQVHMENLLAFYRRLAIDSKLGKRGRVVGLYGDHMPAINGLFTAHGFTERAVDYLIWNSERPAQPVGLQKIENFANTILTEANISLKNI